MSSTDFIGQLGRELFDLERAAQSRRPLREQYPDLSLADAYAIQEAYADLRRSNGARLVGRKIGATSLAIQRLFDIDTPDFGHVFDDMVHPNGGSIRASDLIAPKVEPEVAFLLKRDLSGTDLSIEDVLAATDAVLPCLEIIDSRIDDWDIAFVDTVADNGSSARCVLGEPRPLGDLDLSKVLVTMTKNGTLASTGSGDAVLGHPATSVAWLVGSLAAFGRGLRAGEYVLSGSLTTAIPAVAGDTFTAEFSELGSVSCTFE